MTTHSAQEIWSLFKETSQQLKKTSQQIDKLSVETNEQIKDLSLSQKQTSQQIKDLSLSQKQTSQQIKDLSLSQKQTSQQIKDLSLSQKQTSLQMKELSAKTNEQMKKTDIKLNKFIGETGNRWGTLGENLVKGSLAQRLKERGIKVEGVITNLNKGSAEFDIIAVNGTEIVVVEVKATLDPSDVDKFKKNIDKFKSLWPDFKEKTVYGAMAYLIKANRQAESLADKQGFFVISATGDVIIKNDKDFKPKVFS